MIGSPAYMSPEQLKDRAPSMADGHLVAGRDPVEMLAGKRPFMAKTLPELCPLI